jgi:hypothetical protein
MQCRPQVDEHGRELVWREAQSPRFVDDDEPDQGTGDVPYSGNESESGVGTEPNA